MKFPCHKLSPIVAIAIFGLATMVASFSALGGNAPQPNTGAIAGYFAGAGYYAGEGGAVSWWLGEGAEALGLRGEVRRWQLECTLAGMHPFSRQQLIQIQRQKRNRSKPESGPTPDDPRDPDNARPRRKPRRDRSPGVDVCLTPSKSIGALLAVLDEPLRQNVLAALDRAACSTLELAEKDLLLGRSGKGGWRKENPKLVISVFRELVNRNLEPNPHWHCVFSNMGLCRDGKWRSLNTTILRDWALTLTPIFASNVAKELRALGLELEWAKTADGQPADWFEIKGVPNSVIERWSSRRAEIEKAVDGDAEKFNDATGAARQSANLASRKAKQETPPEAELFDRWRQEAAALGFTPKMAGRLFGKTKAIDVEAVYEAAWNKALAKLNHECAYFAERHLTLLVTAETQIAGLSGVEVARRVKRALQNSPEIVRRGKLAGEQQFTTRTTWDLECKLIKAVEKLQALRGAAVSAKAVARTLKKHKGLNAEQQAAVRHILTDKSAIKVLTGVAGAGKSTSLKAVKEALVKAGYRPIGGALAGAAKEELVAKTGMPSRTVASYLWHLKKSPWRKVRDHVRHAAKQMLRAALGKNTYGPTKVKFDSRTVLFLDECGMLHTKALFGIIRQVQKAKGTIVLTGDVAQLPPILAGGPLKHITEKVGHAHLSKNERQKDARDQEAVKALREGRADEALRNYAERGRLKIGRDKEDAIKQLVAEWSKNGGIENPKEHVIFAQTRREARALNAAAQKERQRFGAVRSWGGVGVGEERIFVGDRVIFHKPLRKWGAENGHRATVLRVNPILRTITVRLDHQPPSLPGQKPRSQTVTIPLRALGKDGLTLGMAATTHKFQGQTCDHSYVLMASRLTSKEMGYVQATRARHTTTIFSTVHHAGPNGEILAQALKKSVAKDLAHDLPDPARRPSSSPELRQHIKRELS